jgi:hypothetical protein
MRLLPVVVLAAVSLGVFLGVAVFYGSMPPPTPDQYNQTSLTVITTSGEAVVPLNVEVPTTRSAKYHGLSGREELDDDEGMLFVYDTAGNKSMEMRGMFIGLDMLFIDENGTVTAIRSFEKPSGADRLTPPGVTLPAKAVLEVPYGWADRYNVTVGAHVGGIPDSV